MNAVVFHGAGDIRMDEVPEPELTADTDATVRIGVSAMCERDLMSVAGAGGRMEPGTILGHEGVGIIERVGKRVPNFREGDRVVIPATAACGTCDPCHNGCYSQCDTMHAHGPDAGPAFFGGCGCGIDGLHADVARIPYARVNMVHIPDAISDEQALLTSDIFPTGYFGAEAAGVSRGNTVAVFGCGPVGQFAIVSAFHLGAERVIAFDASPRRLDVARELGAEPVNWSEDNPIAAIRDLTGGLGADCVIETAGAAAEHKLEHGTHARIEGVNGNGNGNGHARNGVILQARITLPGSRIHALRWSVESARKCGSVAVVGAYPKDYRSFPVDVAASRNVRVHMGTCNHRKYVSRLLGLMESGEIDVDFLLGRDQPIVPAVEAYDWYDARERGWVMVNLRHTAIAA